MPYTNLIGAGWAVNGAPLLPGGGAIPLANNYLFVNNATGFNGSDGNAGTADAPFATLNAALVVAGVTGTYPTGSVIIVVGQGHAETISANTALAFNVAGIQIIGLGTGANRPTFTFDTANSNRIAVTAANIKLQNCIFVGNFLSIATLFLVGAAPGFIIDSCAFRDTSNIKGFLSIVTTTVGTNSDGLTFTNNEVISLATTTPGPAIVVLNTMNRLTIMYNYVNHNVANDNVSLLLSHAALVVTNLQMAYNVVWCPNTDTATGGMLLTTTAITGSGVIYNNYAVTTADAAGQILFPAIAVQYGAFNNQVAYAAGAKSGFLIPAVGP